jgi:hypothetical protein
LDFFNSRFGSGRGGDTGGDVLAADPAASSRLLFFPPAAFVVFDEMASSSKCTVSSRAFARGATALALYGARGWIYKLSMAAVAHQWRFLARSAGNSCSCVG